MTVDRGGGGVGWRFWGWELQVVDGLGSRLESVFVMVSSVILDVIGSIVRVLHNGLLLSLLLPDLHLGTF